MIAVQCGNNAFAVPEYAHVKLAEDGAAHLKVENRSVMIRIFEVSLLKVFFYLYNSFVSIRKGKVLSTIIHNLLNTVDFYKT